MRCCSQSPEGEQSLHLHSRYLLTPPLRALTTRPCCLPQVLQLLADNPWIVMDEHFEGNEDRTEEPEPGEDTKVWGNVVAFVERLDDEHFKSLQVSSPCPSSQ